MKIKELKRERMYLVIAPHVDDEVLGCGGFMARQKQKGYVYYVGIDESTIDETHHRPEKSKRLEEIEKTAKFLGFNWEYNDDNKVNRYNEQDLIGIFENLINRIGPEIILIPHPSYNQDHRAVYNSLLIALRPHDRNFFVKKVLVYEQPHSIIWDRSPINPNYFVEIDIEKKINALLTQESQIRVMRSPEIIKAVARLRGAHINVRYAEAFKILRWAD